MEIHERLDEIRSKKTFGTFSKIIIENFEPEIVFKDGIFQIKENKISVKTGGYEFENVCFINGKKIKEEFKRYNNDIININNFFYDNRDNIIEIRKFYSNENSIIQKYLFSYNSINQKILEEKFQFGNSQWTNHYSYDKNGKLIKESWVSRKYPLIDFFYEYDSFGNNTKKTGKYLLGEIETFLRIEKKFDEKNRCVYEYKEEFNDHSGLSKITREFEYGEYEDLIVKEKFRRKEFDFYDGDFKYEYDEMGNITNFIVYKNGQIQEKRSWKYEYDQNLNWIHSIESINDKPYLITKRKFIK